MQRVNIQFYNHQRIFISLNILSRPALYPFKIKVGILSWGMLFKYSIPRFVIKIHGFMKMLKLYLYNWPFIFFMLLLASGTHWRWSLTTKAALYNHCVCVGMINKNLSNGSARTLTNVLSQKDFTEWLVLMVYY